MVVPPFVVGAAWIISFIDIGLPCGLICLQAGYWSDLAYISEFGLIAISAKGAFQ